MHDVRAGGFNHKFPQCGSCFHCHPVKVPPCGSSKEISAESETLPTLNPFNITARFNPSCIAPLSSPCKISHVLCVCSFSHAIHSVANVCKAAMKKKKRSCTVTIELHLSKILMSPLRSENQRLQIKYSLCDWGYFYAYLCLSVEQIRRLCATRHIMLNYACTFQTVM